MEVRMTQAEIDEAIEQHKKSPTDTLDIQHATTGYVLAVHFGDDNVEYIGIRIWPDLTGSDK